jgi:hypothetical protein
MSERGKFENPTGYALKQGNLFNNERGKIEINK